MVSLHLVKNGGSRDDRQNQLFQDFLFNFSFCLGSITISLDPRCPNLVLVFKSDPLSAQEEIVVKDKDKQMQGIEW